MVSEYRGLMYAASVDAETVRVLAANGVVQNGFDAVTIEYSCESTAEDVGSEDEAEANDS